MKLFTLAPSISISPTIYTAVFLLCNSRIFYRIPYTRLRFLLPNTVIKPVVNRTQRANLFPIGIIRVFTGFAGGANTAAASVRRREPGIVSIIGWWQWTSASVATIGTVINFCNYFCFCSSAIKVFTCNRISLTAGIHIKTVPAFSWRARKPLAVGEVTKKVR